MLPKGTPIITTPQREVRIIQEKQRERQALREYLIKERSNPFRSAANVGVGYISDPAFSRYEAAQTFTSQFKYFKPTLQTTRFFLGWVIGPILGIALVSEYSRRNFEDRCRRGEVSYASRNNKFA